VAVAPEPINEPEPEAVSAADVLGSAFPDSGYIPPMVVSAPVDSELAAGVDVEGLQAEDVPVEEDNSPDPDDEEPPIEEPPSEEGDDAPIQEPNADDAPDAGECPRAGRE
jgi:hypothetical protein